MLMKISETKEGCVLEVSVHPRSREFKVVVEDDDIVIFCRKEPFRGKVNVELVKELTRFLHTPVELISGFTSKEKRLLVRGATKSEIEDCLKRA
jgi:uncharacterized protein (TIGR00251 family)